MALKSPLMPSPSGSLSSAFSPYTDSPHSPAAFQKDFLTQQDQKRNSDSLAPPPSPYPQQVEPSPVDSNGTESTEIEEDAQDEPVKSPATTEAQSPGVDIVSPQSTDSEQPTKLNTSMPPRPRTSGSDENDPQSVIHAPQGFKSFDEAISARDAPTSLSEETIVSPDTPEAAESSQKLVSPVNTNVPPFSDRSTPQAQTRQEVEEGTKRRSRRKSSLEDIPEALDKDDRESESPSTAGLVQDGHMDKLMQSEGEPTENNAAALQTALSECWTLCNTLNSMSSSHRQRSFRYSGKQEQQEQAWRSCWRLCQKLYESRSDEKAAPTVLTLEMCRDFCQALFDVRQKGDEASDSVLRVSFELNNHLYNTYDRSLPEAFNERTLEFYVTMCHRLMKQKTSLPPDTDALLRACWALAEVLFSIHQNQREGKPSDRDLLAAAIQACWDLCNLFREGWTQIQTERGTPRPTQVTFGSQASLKSDSGRPESRTSSSLSGRIYHDARAPPPETPTTIFDDSASATSSPDDVTVPNILVLGPAKPSSSAGGSHRGTHHDRWTSNASVLSGYSESASSNRTSSTATAGKEEGHLTRLRYLLLKAGMTTGYKRSSGQALPAHTRELATSAFGTLPWQMKVFSYYRKLVLNDKTMLSVHKLPPRRVGASEMARSVRWLGDSEQWAWMRDLYRIVFGFGVEEAESRGGGFHVG